ncbi:Zinc finger, C2H2 [Phytophthora cactorum]|nr:Zinc finger, C2H2 [Phytophthora cactorum]
MAFTCAACGGEFAHEASVRRHMRRRICQKRQNPAQVAAERLARRNARRRERYKARRQPAEQQAGQPDPKSKRSQLQLPSAPYAGERSLTRWHAQNAATHFALRALKHTSMHAASWRPVVYELQHGAPPQHQARPFIDSEWEWLDDSGESVEDIAKHVRQRAQKGAAAFENPKKKLLISPEEREIILDAASCSSLFTPSPQQRGAVNADEDSDSEDPGDSADGDPTLSLWGEFLGGFRKRGNWCRLRGIKSQCCKHWRKRFEGYEKIERGRFGRIRRNGDAVKQPFTNHNDRTFPQEAVKLRGFRGQKAKLGALFG